MTARTMATAPAVDGGAVMVTVPVEAEPPIGSKYRIPGGWVLTWTRTEDGWQHPGEPCRQGVQCPHPWDVVGPNSVARHLTLCLPDDSEPTSLDPLWSAHETEVREST